MEEAESPTQKVKIKFDTQDRVFTSKEKIPIKGMLEDSGNFPIPQSPAGDNAFDLLQAVLLKDKTVHPTPSQGLSGQRQDHGLIINIRERRAEHSKFGQVEPVSTTDKNQHGSCLKRKHDSNERFSISSQRTSPGHNMIVTAKAVMDVTTAYNNDQQTDISLSFSKDVPLSDLKAERFLTARQTAVDKGSFGLVFPLKSSSKQSKPMIVKEIRRNSCVKVDHNEILIPLSLHGKGIVQMLALKCFQGCFWIVMEDAGRSLKWWLTNERGAPFRHWSKDSDNFRNLITQLFKCIRLLEVQGIVHRDIKPENLCLQPTNGGDFVVTLVDFGSAQSAQVEAFLAGHTPEYLPPNLNLLISLVKAKKPYTLCQDTFSREKCDVWGIAIVSLTIFNGGFHPLPQVNEYSQVEAVQIEQRKEVMTQIVNLRDGHFESLVKRIKGTPQLVLRQALRVNRDEACTAREACCWLEEDERRAQPKVQRLMKDMAMASGAGPMQQHCPQKKSTLMGELRGAGEKGDGILDWKVCRQQEFPPVGSCFGPRVTTPPSASEQDLFVLGVQSKLNIMGAPHAIVGKGAPYPVVGMGGPRGPLTTRPRMIGRANNSHRPTAEISRIGNQVVPPVVRSRQDEDDLVLNIPNIIFNQDEGLGQAEKAETTVEVKAVGIQPVTENDHKPSLKGDAYGTNTSEVQGIGFVPKLHLMYPDATRVVRRGKSSKQ